MEIDSIDEFEEEEKHRGLKFFLGALFFVIVLLLLINYWAVPRGSFGAVAGKIYCENYNFQNDQMQFYNNMRYETTNISYRIYDCPLDKKVGLKKAFEIISNKTILNFYEVASNEQIYVTCSDVYKNFGGSFIAGEGGPDSITTLKNFNLISNGSILLYKTTECEYPNVEMHELLHALGFNHSTNKCNIMFTHNNCNQRISEDIINLINEVYSYPSLPDLSIENMSLKQNGDYIDLKITIKNNGLMSSSNEILSVFVDSEKKEDFEIASLDIGEGLITSVRNIKVGKDTKEVKVVVNSKLGDLNETDNSAKVFFDLKK